MAPLGGQCGAEMCVGQRLMIFQGYGAAELALGGDGLVLVVEREPQAVGGFQESASSATAAAKSAAALSRWPRSNSSPPRRVSTLAWLIGPLLMRLACGRSGAVAVGAAGPAAGAAFACLEVFAAPGDAFGAGFGFFGGFYPADPFVAGERCEVCPGGAGLRVCVQRSGEVGREGVDRAAGEGC